MKGVVAEALALLAQCAAFFVGLVLSLILGMVLAAHLDGPGGLLIATVLSGAGLLGAAVGSQALRDYLSRRDTPEPQD
ncbi:MAG: hypothetical protein JWN44_4269 [Myxococcales bacterium]|nr:hypothetical protein [Myxococcales bacterium]